MRGAVNRYLAGQFARPHGAFGRLIAPLLNQSGAAMMRDAVSALALQPGERLLDLGFGGGALSAAALQAGAIVTGVDRSAAMVARANARFAAAISAGQARFIEGAAEALPLPDAAVDCATSVNTLYFWQDLDTVPRELWRVIAPGGRLVLGWQTADSVRAWPGHIHGFRAWDDAPILSAVARAGFTIGPLSSGHHRMVGDYRTLVALRSMA